MSLNRREFAVGAGASLAVALAPHLVHARAAGRRPRVLLVSGWQTVNIGDIGHTPGVLAQLETDLPEVDLWLWPRDIGDGVEPMLRRRFPKVRIVQKPDEVATAFSDCDFLLHGSGPNLVATKNVAEWREKTGKPYGVYGITVAPKLGKAVIDLLSGARFVYLRDTISLKAAQAQGISSPVLAFGPDGAFSVDLRDDEKAVPFLRGLGLEDGKFLVAIPKYRNTRYWKIHGQPMTDTQKARQAENEAMRDKDHGLVLPALIAVARETDLKVLVCPEMVLDWEIGQEQFIDKLPADVRDKFALRDRYWLTDEAVSVYVRSAGMVSMDMHSPIMALGNGVPAIHCRFRNQTSKGHMWRDIGLEEWLFDLDYEPNGDAIKKATLAMVQDPAAAKAKAAKALAFVRARQKEMAATLAKQLSG
jgi:hypothetical protein